MRNTDGNVDGNTGHAYCNVNTCMYAWLQPYNIDGPDDRSWDDIGGWQQLR